MRPERLTARRPGRLTARLILAGCVALLSACADKGEAPPDPTPPLARSARGNLRFKGPERLNGDIAAALELPKEAVCAELGLYPCAALVHNVALGGVDPFGPGLYEPPGVTGVTTPLVVERIAWSACAARVEADRARPAQAVIFRGLPLAGARLTNPAGDEVRGAIAQLTQRALQRDPAEAEVARYAQLARDIEQTGDGEPARSWMQAVCFAVLSSAESVFY